jgi:hypothetical protein
MIWVVDEVEPSEEQKKVRMATINGDNQCMIVLKLTWGRHLWRWRVGSMSVV